MHKTEFDHRELPEFQRRVFLRWRAALRGDRLPSMDEFDFGLQDPSGTLIVVEIHRDAQGVAEDFSPIYMGPALDQGAGRRFLGRKISTIPGKGPGSRIWAAYQALANDGVPLFVTLPFVGEKPGIGATCEIVLPLSGRDPTRADFALTALTFVPAQSTITAP